MQVTQRLSSVERSAVSAGPRASAGMERDRIRISILDEAAIVCHAYLSLFFPSVYEHGFLILSKTKETPGLPNPIVREPNFELKEFTLGSGSKVWKKWSGANVA